MPRRKKSRTAKILSGTFRKDRDGDRTEPKLDPVKDPAALVRPTWFDDAAVRCWDYTLPIMIRMGTITIADLQIFIDYCSCVSMFEAAQKDIDETGLTVMGAAGIKKNPSVTIRDEQIKHIRQHAADLGLTPASRASLNAKPPQELTKEEKEAEATALRLLGPNPYK